MVARTRCVMYYGRSCTRKETEGNKAVALKLLLRKTIALKLLLRCTTDNCKFFNDLYIP